MVKIGKLWGDARFDSLSPNSKLLYCYLFSQPNISTLGLIVIDKNKILLDTKLKSIDKPLGELLKGGYVKVHTTGDILSVVVIGHWKSLAKSKANIRKALEEGASANPTIKAIYRSIYSKEDFEAKGFKEPTPKEVADYALSEGYLVNGKGFCEYYGNNNWYDKNNKLVRNWKAKVRNVWCRDENRLESADGAPKGFEYFFVELESGDRISPSSWKDGLPQHGNFVYAQYLINEFNEKNSS